MKLFVQERLIHQENTGQLIKRFYGPMKRSSITTMTELTKSVCIKSKTVHK